MRYALISNNQVINIILWDGTSPYVPPDSIEVVDIDGVTADIGWTYADGVFTPPEAQEPVEDTDV